MNRYMVLVGILLVGVMLISGCVERAAESGDTVRVDYTGKLLNGTEFDSSVDRGPLEFTIDSGRLISRFEQAVIGMKVGESKTITIPAEEAYGPRYKELVFEVDRSQFSDDAELEVGSVINFYSPELGGLKAVVLAVAELTVTLDCNHPLAGQDLVFDIELIEIVEGA
jgi:peptidylprolyl isomerase